MVVKKLFMIIPLTIGVCLFNSCFSAKQATAPAKQTFTFGYKTHNTAKPGSSSVLLALVRPYYANNFQYSQNELYENFRKNMGDDIQQLLNDKGFNFLHKSFQSFNELTYDDKKTSDIVLDIKIVPMFTAAEGGWSQYSPLFSAYTNQASTYGYVGTVSLTGHIFIAGIEPLTNQQIFTKSLDIPVVQNIAIKTSHNLATATLSSEFFNEPSVYNALGTALQQSYTNIMQQIDIYLDPQELASFKAEVKELKSKKVF